MSCRFSLQYALNICLNINFLTEYCLSSQGWFIPASKFPVGYDICLAPNNLVSTLSLKCFIAFSYMPLDCSQFHRLLHSSTVLSYFNLNSRGHESIQHALWSRFLRILSQIQQKQLMLLLEDQWILPVEDLKVLDPRATPSKDADKLEVSIFCSTFCPIFRASQWGKPLHLAVKHKVHK